MALSFSLKTVLVTVKRHTIPKCKNNVFIKWEFCNSVQITNFIRSAGTNPAQSVLNQSKNKGFKPANMPPSYTYPHIQKVVFEEPINVLKLLIFSTNTWNVTILCIFLYKQLICKFKNQKWNLYACWRPAPLTYFHPRNCEDENICLDQVLIKA